MGSEGKKNSTSGIVKGVCLAKMGKIAVAPMFLIMSFMTWGHCSFWVHDLNLRVSSFKRDHQCLSLVHRLMAAKYRTKKRPLPCCQVKKQEASCYW